MYVYQNLLSKDMLISSSGLLKFVDDDDVKINNNKYFKHLTRNAI